MKKINVDFLIVGCGFYGAVLAERISTVLKKKVLILDKRAHIGGNCFSEYDQSTKIEYHRYGTHIFHTSNEKVWKYICNFTKFNSYRHQVLSRFKKNIYQMPINLETINHFFNRDFNPIQAKSFIIKETLKYKKNFYSNFEEKALSQIGKHLYEAFIKSYTEKQWKLQPKYLPSSIFNRLPLRFNYNEDYFNNCKFQGIPLNGYTQIFQNLLKNKLINFDVENYKLKNKYNVKYCTIYTGPLDSLFDFKFGKLSWRSLVFKKKIFKCNDIQGTSVINYPEKKFKYTRIHEPKHLHPERKQYELNKSILIYEYPNDNINEPYYPINNEHNRNLHRKYKLLTRNIKNFFIGGRLADYAYYDMDMTISAALQKFELIKKNYE